MTVRARWFRAQASELSAVRRFVVTCAEADRFDEDLSDLLIAASEACANAIAHSKSAAMSVTWEALDDAVELTVEDAGVFRSQVGLPELDGTAHRGIALMIASMDEVAISEGSPERPGTQVRMRKRKSGRTPAGRGVG